MSLTGYQQFFLQPTDAWHRRYEALRLVFVDQRPLKEVAQNFEVSYGTLCNWVTEFRAQQDGDERSPFFKCPPEDDRPCDNTESDQPEIQIADVRELSLEIGRRIHTRCAGLFLFLPLLAQLRFDQLVKKAGYPGTKMVPAPCALLSLLTLKLLDKERLSHIDDFNCDEALEYDTESPAEVSERLGLEVISSIVSGSRFLFVGLPSDRPPRRGNRLGKPLPADAR